MLITKTTPKSAPPKTYRGLPLPVSPTLDSVTLGQWDPADRYGVGMVTGLALATILAGRSGWITGTAGGVLGATGGIAVGVAATALMGIPKSNQATIVAGGIVGAALGAAVGVMATGLDGGLAWQLGLAALGAGGGLLVASAAAS